MDAELREKIRPDAVEILGLVESAVTGPVERARRADCLDFETAEELLAFLEKGRNRTISYLIMVGKSEGRKPYLITEADGS